jgi:hypothetical protein
LLACLITKMQVSIAKPLRPNIQKFVVVVAVVIGRDGSVGIATRYGPDGPAIESRWGRDFWHPSRQALGPTQPQYKGYRVFPGGRAAGA